MVDKLVISHGLILRQTVSQEGSGVCLVLLYRLLNKLLLYLLLVHDLFVLQELALLLYFLLLLEQKVFIHLNLYHIGVSGICQGAHF